MDFIENNQELIDDVIFKHPFTCMIAGPSKSGKTTLLSTILENNHKMIYEPPDRIVYCYTRWQPAFEKLKSVVPSIEFNEGLPDIENFSADKRNLLILDDLMRECGKNDNIYDVFTVDSHHKSISVFFMTQNIFPREKNARTISLNCNYIIILNNPRDREQVFHLAKQMFPKQMNYFKECYQDAVESKTFGYLFLDLTQTQNNSLRVQTGICPKEKRIIYKAK